MIYILTGEIRSGKTTALLNWSKNRTDVDGLLCPDNESGKRYFLKVKSKAEFELEVIKEVEAEELIQIGNFKFLKAAFKHANEYLISRASKLEGTYLIIDELGKLELKNEGLHRSAEVLIPNFSTNKHQHLILVVRDYLLQDVLTHYSISDYHVLTNADLKTLN